MHVDQSLLKVCAKFIAKVTSLGDREDQIFVNVIKDKNENGWYQTEKSIIGPALNFNKRFKIRSLNKKFGKTFQKSMILKVSEKENL